MRELKEPLPSKKEAAKETKVRLKTLDEIVPKLTPVSEAVILVGSLANGKNFSVRKESDIDLIILINRKKANNIFNTGLFPKKEHYMEPVKLFLDKKVDHFTFKEIINGVEVQFHFWNKKTHFRTELLLPPNPTSYKSMRPNPKYHTNTDFSGTKRKVAVGEITRYKCGIAYEYPPFFISEGHFVPKEPIINLIADSEILFLKDKQLLKNIDLLWEKLAERLIKESKGKINLKKRSILFSLYGYWNFSPSSKRKIRKREKEEIVKLLKN